MAYLATCPAYAAVPQATTTILSTARSTASSMRISSSTSLPDRSSRPSSVSETACGWSWISFSMLDALGGAIEDLGAVEDVLRADGTADEVVSALLALVRVDREVVDDVTVVALRRHADTRR